MEVEIVQHREDKKTDNYVLEVDAGVVVLQMGDKTAILPIVEMAGVRSVKPFYDIPKKEMEHQRKFVVDTFKKLEKQ